MHQSIPAQGKWLQQVVRGYFNYYAVPTNRRAIAAFRDGIVRGWRRALRRRSQKDDLTRERIKALALTVAMRSFIGKGGPLLRQCWRHSAACAINPVNLIAGDILVLYTDGVTEASNSQGEEFGMERLSNLIRRGHTLSADALMKHILGSVADFSRDVGFDDDATILVVKFTFDSM